MDNSIYVALSGQLALFRDLDVTANNIANANTTGYNAEHILFSSYMGKDANHGDSNPMSFANDVSTFRNTEEGSMKVTGNDLDVAIVGEGYFTVQTPLGIRYTRAGNFQTDGNGTLTTMEGYPVLDNAGQTINLPEDTKTVVIGEAGNMKVNGDDFATIGLVQFDNPQLLERLTGKMFKSSVAGQPAQNARITQGMLEGANVQPVTELTHMMNLQQAVTDSAQFIAVIYDLERKAADAWAQQS